MQEHPGEYELQHGREWVLVHDWEQHCVFAGDGARRIEQDSDHVIQSIERVFLAGTTNIAQEEDAIAETAIGFCRFGDVTKRGSMIECVAHTRAGLYEGAFVTDGNPPKLDTIQIGP